MPWWVRRFRELFEELGITGIDPEQYNADYLNNLALLYPYH